VFLERGKKKQKETKQRIKRNLFVFLVLQEKLKEEPKKQKYKNKDMVSNIYTIIMMLKIKNMS
jgi:hypothetical protein